MLIFSYVAIAIFMVALAVIYINRPAKRKVPAFITGKRCSNPECDGVTCTPQDCAKYLEETVD